MTIRAHHEVPLLAEVGADRGEVITVDAMKGRPTDRRPALKLRNRIAACRQGSRRGVETVR